MAMFMTHITCRLTANNQDQLRNPMLGNRLWSTVTFLMLRGCRSLANNKPDSSKESHCGSVCLMHYTVLSISTMLMVWLTRQRE